MCEDLSPTYEYISNIVHINAKADDIKYIFSFTINNSSAGDKISLELPVEFTYMNNNEKEIIASLLISYFFSAKIFVRASVDCERNNESLAEIEDEKIELIIGRSLAIGFYFDYKVPIRIRGHIAECTVAILIAKIIKEYSSTFIIDTDHI
jgi:hypothetical protein